MPSKALIATITIALQSASAVQLYLDLESQVEATLNAGQRSRTTDCTTATIPSETGYFCSTAYLAKTKEAKMIDLWGMVLSAGTNQTPASYMWSDFDDIFTGSSRSSFS